jgi:16S rRNA (guanine1207-N2)-methyltransferase
VKPADVDGDLRFAGIWSNPPIRVGKSALHELLSTWLARLAPGGHAYLVVQKHLGSDSLQRWPTEQGWASDRLGSRAGYRILAVTSAEVPT